MKRALFSYFERLATAAFGASLAFAAYHAPGIAPFELAIAIAAGLGGWWGSRWLLQSVPDEAAPRPQGASGAAAGELDSEVVVRLFDTAALPSPARRMPRNRRLAEDVSLAAPPDASDALREALSDLRRSLH